MEFVTSLKEVFNLNYQLSKAKKFLRDKQEKAKETDPSKEWMMYLCEVYIYINTLTHFFSIVIAENVTAPPPSYDSAVQEKLVTEVKMLLSWRDLQQENQKCLYTNNSSEP